MYTSDLPVILESIWTPPTHAQDVRNFLRASTGTSKCYLYVLFILILYTRQHHIVFFAEKGNSALYVSKFLSAC